MYADDIRSAAADIVAGLKRAGLKVVTAESCTGGLVAGALTEIPGSSAVFDRGFITYSNEAKIAALGVGPDLIARHGAVSAEVAVAMAEGARARSLAQLAVAITGIAGPGGATATKPVGLVHLAVARADGPTVVEEHRYGDLGRTEVREAAVRTALSMLGAALNRV